MTERPSWYHRLITAAQAVMGRSFVVGPAVVNSADMIYGMSGEQFQPEEYGDYIATSLGVYTCSNIRAKLLSSLPLKLYRLRKNGEREEVQQGEAFVLLQKVNPFWTFPRLIEMTELSLCLWGEAFWFIERGGRARQGIPQELWWARPDRVRVVPDPVNYVKGFVYAGQLGNIDLAYPREETVWLRYANPLDEFEGLSPLAAARLSADVASAAMKSNRNIFANGSQIAGFVGPDGERTLTIDEQRELEDALSRRFKGADKAHRIAVMKRSYAFQSVSMTPKDAEFIEAMRWTLEDISRAYGVPLDLIGGQRTYANLEASERIMWSHTIKAEANFIATEITEQLLPMFGTGTNRVDLAEFDLSDVDALKEDEQKRWAIDKEQIEVGVKTRNEWRADEGLDPLEWGDVWWAPLNLIPVADAELPAPELDAAVEPMPLAISEPMMDAEDVASPGDEELEPESRRRRIMEIGSPEHEQRWRLTVRRMEPHEKRLGHAMAEIFRRQRSAVLAKLRKRSARAVDEEGGDDELTAAELAALVLLVDNPFDKPRWIKETRVATRPIILAMIEDAGQSGLADIGIGQTFNADDPRVISFLEKRAQRFAREVNETTWRALKASLADGLKAKESIDQLADRVETVMGTRSRAAAVSIARTEVTGAMTGARELAWAQSGQVFGKTWVSSLDERVRPTHASAHGQTVALDEDFSVGGATGPGPGQMSSAEESVNCRCWIEPHLLPRTAPRRQQSDPLMAVLKVLQLPEVSVNGHARALPEQVN